MNRITFECGIKDLATQYGDRHFSSIRNALIWEVVCGVPDKAFQNLVKHIIKYEKVPPMVDKFEEFAKKFALETQSLKKESFDCSWCEDKALAMFQMKKELIAENTELAETCMAICTCAIGNAYANRLLNSSRPENKETGRRKADKIPYFFDWYERILI